MLHRPSILSRFLFRRFLSGFALVLFVICGIIFAVTFVEQLPSAGTATAALWEAYTRLLEYIPLFLPLVVFMGTLMTSYTLTKSSENIIISSAGLSPYHAMKPFLFCAVLLGIVSSALLNPYSVKVSTQDIKSDHLTLIDDAIWLREILDDNILTLRSNGMIRPDENTIVFQDVMIIQQNETQKISHRIEAETVILTDGHFAANDANQYGADGHFNHGKWATESNLTAETVLDRYLKANQVSFWQLPKFIHEMRHIGLNTRPHLIQLWTLLFMPLTLIAMVVLGVAFSQTHERRNYSFGIKFSIGIVTCFALYFIMNVFSTIGASGGLPTILAVLAPPLIIITAAATFIVTFDSI